MAFQQNVPTISYATQPQGTAPPIPSPSFSNKHQTPIFGRASGVTQTYSRKRGQHFGVFAATVILTVVFSVAAYISKNAQIRRSDLFHDSGVLTMSNYNALISGLGNLIGSVYGFALARGAAAALQKRLTHQGATLREADFFTRVGGQALPRREVSLLAIIILGVFGSGAASSAAFQASFGASSTTYTSSYVSAFPNLAEAVSLISSDSAKLGDWRLGLGQYADTMPYFAMQNPKLTLEAYAGGGRLRGNSAVGWSSFSSLAQYITSSLAPLNISGITESDHDWKLRMAAKSVDLKGTQQAFWATTSCQPVGSSALTYLSTNEDSRGLVRLINTQDASICTGVSPLDLNTSNSLSMVGYTCAGTHTLYLSLITNVTSRPSTAPSWACSSSIKYQDVDYLYTKAVGAEIVAAGDFTAVDETTQFLIIDDLNDRLFSNYGFDGILPLVNGLRLLLETVTAVPEDQLPLVFQGYLEKAIGGMTGVYTAVLSDVAASSASQGEITASRMVQLHSIFPVVSFGMNSTHTKSYIMALWLVGLFVPVFAAWVVLVLVTFVTPILNSDFTDPVAVMLQAVSDITNPYGDSFEGHSLGTFDALPKSTFRNIRIYFRATAHGSSPRRAYFALDPPNFQNGEALITGEQYD